MHKTRPFLDPLSLVSDRFYLRQQVKHIYLSALVTRHILSQRATIACRGMIAHPAAKNQIFTNFPCQPVMLP